MSDVTQILSQIEAGDPAATEQLLPLALLELPLGFLPLVRQIHNLATMNRLLSKAPLLNQPGQDVGHRRLQTVLQFAHRHACGRGLDLRHQRLRQGPAA